MNLQSVDPSLQSGCSGEAPAISAGQIAAAITMSPPPLRLACRYMSRQQALGMMSSLLFAKYTLDAVAKKQLRIELLVGVLAHQLEEESVADPRAMVAEIKENRGVMSACVDVVIADVCSPSLFIGLSARAWARKLGLSNHKQWQSRWKRRYDNLRMVVQEMDDSIIELIEKRL